ncbi:MAG: dTDP-4-dehydrorhamnose 3,5-epimerase family protein [Clostridium sp.]
MFKVRELDIPGCFLITPNLILEKDLDLVKVFSSTQFTIYGLKTKFSEEYYALPKPGTLRGIHFQSPPEAHEKLITCISGSILDIVVDLRKESPAYGKCIITEINDDNKELIYIPKGCGHGYYVKGKKSALILYKVTKPYINQYKGGINVESFSLFPIDLNKVIISDNDKKLPYLREFDSPFKEKI